MTTTTPQQRIEADVKTAMKAGEKERLSTLRMLLTEIKNERIRRGSEVDAGGRSDRSSRAEPRKRPTAGSAAENLGPAGLRARHGGLGGGPNPQEANFTHFS